MKTKLEIESAKSKAIAKRFPHHYTATNRKAINGFSAGWDEAIAFMQTDNASRAISPKKTLGNGYYGHFDGSCNPNPRGNMGIGCYLYEKTDSSKRKIFEHSEELFAEDFNHLTSNNVAETLALDKLIAWMLSEGMQNAPITIYGDSKIVINAVRANYASKGIFAPYMADLKKSVKLFSNLTLQWIPRHLNSDADILSKIR